MVKLESLKRWNEERGLWCEKGVQVLLTTVGAFAAFGLMTIAISTDYWLYTRAFICNTTNLTAGAGGDDGPPQRGGGGAAEKKDPGGLTHSGLWRICCLEGRAPRPRPQASRVSRGLHPGWPFVPRCSCLAAAPRHASPSAPHPSHPPLGPDPRLNPAPGSPLHHSAGPLEPFPLPSLRGESAPSSRPPTPPGVRPPSTRGPPQPGPQRWHPLPSRPPALSPLISRLLLLARGIVAPRVLALSAPTSDDPVSSAFLIPFDPLAPRGLFVPSNIMPRGPELVVPLLFAFGGLSSGSLVLASSPRLRLWSLSFLALCGALLPIVSTQPPFGLFLSQRRHCLFQSPSPLFLWSCSFPLAASLPAGCPCLPPTPTVPLGQPSSS